MRKIANFIVKTNKWYENLPKLKGEMFYLGLVFIPYITIMFSLIVLVPAKNNPGGILSTGLGLSWVILVCLWRVSFEVIKDRRRVKRK